jgi:hypothetical protein
MSMSVGFKIDTIPPSSETPSEWWGHEPEAVSLLERSPFRSLVSPMASSVEDMPAVGIEDLGFEDTQTAMTLPPPSSDHAPETMRAEALPVVPTLAKAPAPQGTPSMRFPASPKLTGNTLVIELPSEVRRSAARHQTWDLRTPIPSSSVAVVPRAPAPSRQEPWMLVLIATASVAVAMATTLLAFQALR